MSTVVEFTPDEESLIAEYARQCDVPFEEAVHDAALAHIRAAVDDPFSMEMSDFLTEFGGME